MATNPKEFLSRTGYRLVEAATVGDSINLPGSPTTTTQPPLTNNTTIATTAYVDSAIVVAAADFTNTFLLMGA